MCSVTWVDKLDCLRDILEGVMAQKHGTTVVISTRAQKEAGRLTPNAVAVEPVPLSSSLMQAISSVDGAVLMGIDGFCYAFGAILDGNVQKEEDPACGARHNSALRYVKTQNKKHGSCCCAIVVSEDGPVSFFPRE